MWWVSERLSITPRQLRSRASRRPERASQACYKQHRLVSVIRTKTHLYRVAKPFRSIHDGIASEIWVKSKQDWSYDNALC